MRFEFYFLNHVIKFVLAYTDLQLFLIKHGAILEY